MNLVTPSSRSRRTASLARFFDLSHVLDGPLRYGESVRFDTLQSHAADVPEHAWAVFR